MSDLFGRKKRAAKKAAERAGYEEDQRLVREAFDVALARDDTQFAIFLLEHAVGKKLGKS